MEISNIEESLKVINEKIILHNKECQELKWIDKELNETFENILNDGHKEISKLVAKLKIPYNKCILLGSVSSGKSTFINCLLEQNILLTGNSLTTKELVEIKRSKDGNYLEFNGEKKDMKELQKPKEISLTKKAMNLVFSSSSTEFIFPDDLMIIDTPGVETDENKDNVVEKKCYECDLVIALMHSRSSLLLKEISIMENTKTQFSKFNVFIIFNFMDEIYDDKDVEESMKQNKDKVKDTLTNKLSMSPDEADKRIHFISSKNVLKCIESQNTSNIDENYTKMVKELKLQLEKTFKERCSDIYKNITKEIVPTILENCKSVKVHFDKRLDYMHKLENDIITRIQTEETNMKSFIDNASQNNKQLSNPKNPSQTESSFWTFYGSYMNGYRKEFLEKQDLIEKLIGNLSEIDKQLKEIESNMESFR